MHGAIPMLRSRVMPLIALSTVILVAGCVTSVKVRRSASCPTCQQGQYASPQSVPVDASGLYPIPEIPPSSDKGNSEQTTPPAPYPAPPPEARRLQPNFRGRTTSAAMSPTRSFQ